MLQIVWMAPFYSGGGYCSEAYAFALSIQSHILNTNLQNLSFSLSQHGDSYNQDFTKTLTTNDTALLKSLNINNKAKSTAIFDNIVAICHSEPGAWSVPYANYETVKCPPNYANIKIGRTMFETDRLPDGWTSRLNYMDEIWVPTAFSKEIFINAGVNTNKVRVVPEPVDTNFFTPKNISLFHSDVINYKQHKDFQMLMNAKLQSPNDFFILFVGKWETRKGLKILLRALFKEFENNQNNSNIHLVMLTSQYHSSSNFLIDIYDYLISENLISRLVNIDSVVPHIHVLTNLQQKLMPWLYSMVNVLIVPSHGEGWGRPHVEAMSCETPVIATNWSGPTAYMNDNNSYLLHSDGLVSADGWQGHKWANPSESHLRQLITHVYNHLHAEVKIKGIQARIDMINQYSLSVIGRLTVSEIFRVTSPTLQQQQQQQQQSSFNRNHNNNNINNNGNTMANVEL